MKLQDKYRKGLEAMGYRVTDTRSAKYVAMNKPGLPRHKTLWLGRSGAVRVGRTVSGSVPISDASKARILKARIEAQT